MHTHSLMEKAHTFCFAMFGCESKRNMCFHSVSCSSVKEGKQTQFVPPNTANVNTGKGRGKVTRPVEWHPFCVAKITSRKRCCLCREWLGFHLIDLRVCLFFFCQCCLRASGRLFVLFGVELHMLGKRSTVELYSQPLLVVFCLWNTDEYSEGSLCSYKLES